jgi:RHS repeat-associated protein
MRIGQYVRTAAALALGFGTLAIAQEQDHPIEARGMAGGGPVSVSPFSGGLGIAIPIGQTYSVSPQLSYGLTLVYNGNLWDFSPDPSDATKIAAKPSRSSEAGWGWSLSLGRLIPPGHADNPGSRWVYVGPSGDTHYFWATLHEGESAVGSWRYTRDGSYLRMYSNGSDRRVYFPNGVKATYGWTGSWETELVSMEDRFGNSMNVNHLATRWEITDSRGRTHNIYWQDDAELGKIVDQIELEGVGGQTQIWNFDYAWRDVSRTCRDDAPSTPATVNVPLLEAIWGPVTGLNYTMKKTNGQPDYELGNTNGACSDVSGSLLSLRIPTNAKYSFGWGMWDFPAQYEPSYRTEIMGVTSLTVYDPYLNQSATTTYSNQVISGGTKTTVTGPTGVKTFHYFNLPGSCSDCQRPWDYGLPYTETQSVNSEGGVELYLSSETKGPAGEKLGSTYVRFTRDYHTNGPSSPPYDWRSQSNRRLWISKSFDGDPAGNYFVETVNDKPSFDGLGHFRKTTVRSRFWNTTAGQPGRVTTTNYHPGSTCANPEGGVCPDYDVPSTSEPWILGTFDHTLLENLTGGDDERTDYTFEASTGFLSEVRRRKTEGSVQDADLRTKYTRDAEGNLVREESYGGDPANQSTPTYVLAHAYTDGFRTETTFRDPASGPNFGTVLLSTGESIVDPSTGLVLVATDPNGLETTYTYDLAGRLVKAQDTSDSAVQLGWTLYSYTFGGNFAGATSTVETKVSALDLCPTGTPEQCGNLHGRSIVYLDGFGRTVKERVERDPGVWSMRYNVFDNVGRLTAASEWGADGSGGGETRYSNFDALGRPLRIEAPSFDQNPSHYVTFAYTGAREVSTTTRIAMAFVGAETAQTTTKKLDPFGRLIELVDPATTTSYAYDTAGRLTSITQVAGANSQVRQFVYADDRGFLTKEQHPEKGSTGNGWIHYKSYDAGGNLLRMRDGSDASDAFNVDFAYDGIGRLRTVTSDGAMNRRFTYDEASGGDYRLGKVTTAEAWNRYGTSDPNGAIDVVEKYVYDGRGGAVSQKTTQLSIHGADQGTFTQSFTWNRMGALASESYPTWSRMPTAPSRTVSYGYTRGRLSSVSGYASAIGYHDNFALASIEHSNGVQDWIGKDPSGMGRLSEIHTTGIVGGLNWSTGTYVFDGTGNIRAIGPDRYRYDGVSRLLGTQIQLPELDPDTDSFDDGFERGSACNWDYRTPDPGDCTGELTREANQTTSYDAFTNLTSTTTDGTTQNIPASLATNRLTSASYDERGNTTGWNGNVYDYDRLNQLRRLEAGSQKWQYAYAADGERIATVKSPSTVDGPRKITIRGLGGQVLREFELDNAAAAPEWKRDWIYGNGLLAAVSYDAGHIALESAVHFTLDHLGSPRIVTDDSAVKIAEHTYWPYGTEATTFDQDDLAMKFTGHERDLNAGSSPGDDYDYMHARSFSAVAGRFLQYDPARGLSPRSLNRYSYVSGRPITSKDPDGREIIVVWDEDPCPNVPLGNPCNTETLGHEWPDTRTEDPILEGWRTRRVGLEDEKKEDEEEKRKEERKKLCEAFEKAYDKLTNFIEWFGAKSVGLTVPLPVPLGLTGLFPGFDFSLTAYGDGSLYGYAGFGLVGLGSARGTDLDFGPLVAGTQGTEPTGFAGRISVAAHFPVVPVGYGYSNTFDNSDQSSMWGPTVGEGLSAALTGGWNQKLSDVFNEIRVNCD